MSLIGNFIRAQAEGKAIPNHRFFHDDSPLSYYVPGGSPSRERGVISQREARHHIQAYGGDEAMDWVMAATTEYSQPTAQAPWHVEHKGKKLAIERTEENIDTTLADQQFVNLLKHPNPLMRYEDLIELMVIDLLLVGNAYWYTRSRDENNRPLELWRLSPSDVKIKPAQVGIQHYEYAPSGVRDPLIISPENVIHFKRPNPHSPYYGLGVIKGGGRAADIDLAMTDAQAWYFENKADPSIVVQSERRVPRDVFKKLRAQLRARASGRHNTGEMLVLEAGLKASSLSTSAREAMYKELSNVSRDRVLSWFKVNPKLIGIAEVGTSGDKVQDARREFDNKQLRPFMTRVQEIVTDELASLWDYTFKIDYRYVMPQEELVKLSSDFSALPGIKVKEIRRFLVEGGIIDEESTGEKDIDELVLNLPGENLDANGQGGFADRPVGSEPGRPPKGENTKVFPTGTAARQGKAVVKRDINDVIDELDFQRKRRAAQAEGKAKVTFEPTARTTIGNKLPDEQRPADPLLDVRTREVDAIAQSMQPDILNAVRRLERGLLDHAEGKAFEPGTLVKRIRASEAWTTFRNMLREALASGARQAVAASVVQHAELGLRSDEEIDYEEVASSVIERPEGVRGITDNLKQQVIAKVEDALESGDPLDANKAIQETLGYWNTHKAETVADTEATEAYNEGTLTLAQSMGAGEIYVEDGTDHDQPCADAHGSVWAIDYARKHRTEHPRCRRSFTLLPSSA